MIDIFQVVARIIFLQCTVKDAQLIELHHVEEKGMRNVIVRNFVDEMSDKFVALLEKQLLRERTKRVYRRASLVN